MSNEIVAQGIALLTERAPHGVEVTGQYDEEVNAWTWTIVAQTSEQDDEGNYLLQGVSRQFVGKESKPTPTTEDIDLMATEMTTTLGAAL